MWLAGGKVKGSFVHGATDELGMQAVKDQMHVHDLHATILLLMGVNHECLTYRYSGRDFRLTDVSGRVAREILGVTACDAASVRRHSSIETRRTQPVSEAIVRAGGARPRRKRLALNRIEEAVDFARADGAYQGEAPDLDSGLRPHRGVERAR